MLRLRRAVDEVPRSQRALLALDDQERLAGEHEEVLLLGLPVVHAQRLARPEHEQVDADLREVPVRSEEHTSELQSRQYLVCRLLLEKKNRSLSLRIYHLHFR